LVCTKQSYEINGCGVGDVPNSAKDFFPDAKHNTTSWAKLSEFSAEDMGSFIQKYIQPANTSDVKAVGQVEAIRRAIYEYYSSVDVEAPRYLYIQRYTRLLSDIQFIIPSLWEARLKAQSGWPTYIVHFDYFNVAMVGSYPDPLAVSHLSEYPYTVGRVYRVGVHKFDESPPSASLVRALTLDSIVSFIKTGEPSASWPRLNFPETSPTSCTKAMESYRAAMISNEGLCVESGVRSCGEVEWMQSVASRLDFWDKLSASHDLRLVHSFPNTMGRCLPSNEGSSSGANAQKLSLILAISAILLAVLMAW
jgi:Carboxylesterase family